MTLGNLSIKYKQCGEIILSSIDKKQEISELHNKMDARKIYHVSYIKKTVRVFSWVTKTQQQHGKNLVISETIRKSLNVLVFVPGLCTKCSYQQKQTRFCWEETLTQWSITATQYCTSILGHHQGVQPSPTV